MPAGLWSEHERLVLLYAVTVYELTDEQLWDLAGRIFGEDWRDKRKKYTLKDIRDELNSRWKDGHRSKHYSTIDPERSDGLYDASETVKRVTANQIIVTAAAQTTGNNWLRENDQDVLETPNAPIALIPKATPYRRDQSTIQAEFLREKARKAAIKASKQAAKEAAAAQDADSGTEGTAPTPSPRRRNRPTRKRKMTSVSEPPPPSAPPGAHRHRSVRSKASRDNDEVSFHKLPMVHAHAIEVNDARMELSGTRGRQIKSIYKKSEIYLHGGEMIRVWLPDEEYYQDIVLCDSDVCAECSGTGRTGELNIKVKLSLFGGLPFVHLGRDTTTNDQGECVFRQVDNAATAACEMPENRKHLKQTMVWCRSGGTDERVKVLGCVKKKCRVCTPTAVDLESEDEDEDDVGVYGERDVETIGQQYLLEASVRDKDEQTDLCDEEDISEPGENEDGEQGDEYHP
ncbi:hypothetical protein Slin15195_G100690 [Septoria linicola]|uniref:Uncharacterized protein n=1 Tax=Septoria linicola TaxID=215465 RepID=A0A9Q9AX48_9PEZI|nr:hypothetical protein Slin15195_G100690 [Septoria linicola]